MKKFLDFCTRSRRSLTALALSAFGTFAAFAEGEGAGEGGAQIDLSAATTAFNDMSSAVTDWVGTIAPYLATFLGGMLVITLIYVALRWVLRGTKRAG